MVPSQQVKQQKQVGQPTVDVLIPDRATFNLKGFQLSPELPKNI